MANITSGISDGNVQDADYSAHVARLNKHFAEMVDNGNNPVFTTNVDPFGLAFSYLANIKDDVRPRQYYTCSACDRFIRKFGTLVTIDDEGKTRSVLWGMRDVLPEYAESYALMKTLVEKAKVNGVFLTSDAVLGNTDGDMGMDFGRWQHLILRVPSQMVFQSRAQTVWQKRAERYEDFKNVKRALSEFSPKNLLLAVRVLESGELSRAERVLAPAQWLADLQSRTRAATDPNLRDNLIWAAVAKAPSGFCHPRSSVFATLLEDLEADLSFEEAKKRFDAKMHPLAYQRPQAAPKEGAVRAAEKLVADMGITKSLERRHARFSEIVKLWRPTSPAPSEGGVFGRLKKNTKAELLTSPATVKITWEKFRRTVLPTAESIECAVPSGSANFVALVTAVHAEAPPIIQWDMEGMRNPFSWYLYSGGSHASSWGLASGTWVDVKGVTLKPSMWDHENQYEHQGVGAIFILEGCRDTVNSSMALFPEILKSDLHSVRSTIEAYSNTGTLGGLLEADASGLMIDNSPRAKTVRVRVISRGMLTHYDIDRWD